MKTLELECRNCGIYFLRKESRVLYDLRNIKTGAYRTYCSKKCRNSFYKEAGKLENPMLYKKYEHVVFSTYIHRANTKRLKKKGEFEITITPSYLSTIWNKQNGKCVYTGISLRHKSSRRVEDKLDVVYQASLDRIDSEKGYIEGNVQFVSLGINYAKNRISDLEMKEFIRIIRGQN